MTVEGQTQDQTTQTPQPGTAEYNQMMVDRYENQGGQAAEKPTKPESVPEKFWNAEKGVVDYDAMAKSYAELEAKLSGQPQGKPQEGQGDQKQEQTQEGQGDKAEAFNWDSFGERVVNEGSIPEADLAALEKMGIPKHVVEGYVEAITVAKQAAAQNTYTYVGQGDAAKGKADLDKAIAWAADNLDEGQKAFYNEQLKTSAWKLAVDQLISMSGVRNGPTSGEPSKMIQGGEPSGSQGGFSSRQEMVKAMSDPRYKTDPAYRNTVRQRVIASSF